MILHPGTPQETLKLMDFGLAKMSSLLYIAPDELCDTVAARRRARRSTSAPSRCAATNGRPRRPLQRRRGAVRNADGPASDPTKEL